MAWPCCTATTRRVVKLCPSRIRSTVYSTGIDGSPGEEVGVQRVRGASLDGAAGRGQRLRRDLSAEQALALAALVAAAEDVALDLLEVEQLDQSVGGRRHRASA